MTYVNACPSSETAGPTCIDGRRGARRARSAQGTQAGPDGCALPGRSVMMGGIMRCTMTGSSYGRLALSALFALVSAGCGGDSQQPSAISEGVDGGSGTGGGSEGG